MPLEFRMQKKISHNYRSMVTKCSLNQNVALQESPGV